MNLSKLFTFIGIFISFYGYAWGLLGHRIVAEIAERHLSDNAKSQVAGVFGKEKMAYFANWPDYIKSDTTGVWKPMSVWHYVNINPQKDFNSFVTELKAQKSPNLYTQIAFLSNRLKDKSISADEKKTDLVFLIHLIGDMVQPMHTGRAEDLGGNKITITYFGEEMNLHSLWDDAMIENQRYSYTEYATVLDVKSDDEMRTIQQGTLEDWLYDSHKIANRIYSQTPAGSVLKYNYDYKFVPTLERQLLYGGLRLAKVLNDIFS